MNPVARRHFERASLLMEYRFIDWQFAYDIIELPPFITETYWMYVELGRAR